MGVIVPVEWSAATTVLHLANLGNAILVGAAATSSRGTSGETCGPG
jgi:hypothetical protein